jgi:hypothetical protein
VMVPACEGRAADGGGVVMGVVGEERSGTRVLLPSLRVVIDSALGRTLASGKRPRFE